MGPAAEHPPGGAPAPEPGPPPARPTDRLAGCLRAVATRRGRRPAPVVLTRAAAALGLAACLATPVHALTGVQRAEAADLVARCLSAVAEGDIADAAGLRRAEGPVPDAIREARGGRVWTSPFGAILLHQAGPRACSVIAPGADPRAFAFWVERWSNSPDGRAWAGKWFGRLDSTAWRRFRRRGGGPVRVQAVTGEGRATSEIQVLRGYGGR